ncbi:MAG: DUF2156 domain-containing protein [Ruminococcus sp.]|nr:DUF2156 domain-containing protein [Ruminococcus sp.]
MLEFKEIDISDRDMANKALRESDFRGCEYSFANNMAWRRLACSKIAFCKGFYISCAFDTEDAVPLFLFPSGTGSYTEVFAEMKRFAESLGKPLRVSGVTNDTLALLGELFPGQFESEYSRDSSDYIYLTEDLITLPGKKLHAKRNHLARFKQNDYEFRILTERDFDDCITFLTEDYNSREDSIDHSMIAEQFAINTFFSYFSELGLSGSAIWINGKIAAATIGEPICSDTFGVHIEKANTAYPGIYAGINNLYAASVASEYKYVNREEDMGLEGLRKAKLSYRPAFLLDKYTVTFK